MQQFVSRSFLSAFYSCWLKILLVLVLSLLAITKTATAKAQFPVRYSLLFAPPSLPDELIMDTTDTSPLNSFSSNNKRAIQKTGATGADDRHQFIGCTSKGGGKCSMMVNVLRDPRLIPNWNRDAWSKAIAQYNAYQQLFSSSFNEMRRRRRRSVPLTPEMMPDFAMHPVDHPPTNYIHPIPSKHIQIKLPPEMSVRQSSPSTVQRPKGSSNEMRIHSQPLEPVFSSVSTESLSPSKPWDNLAKAFCGCLKRANSKLASSPSKVVPMAEKVHQRHLELEPLCCLSSCIVRGGCYAIVVFELVYILVTLCVVAVKVYDGGRLKFWEELEPNFNAVVTHQLFLYVLIAFDMLSSLMVLTLFRGLVAFERKYVKIHWRYDFLALGFNVCAFVVYLFALSSEGPQTWTLDNIVLMMCFAGQIPLQLWAVTVIKSCYDFFVLLYVFVSLAEK